MSERDAHRQVAQAFKHAMAALRRMRSREHHRPGELRDAQYSLLFSLRDRDQLPTSELALAGDLSPASATELLDGLEVAGLVERTRSLTDRRVVLTSLTDRGRALVEARRASLEPRFRAALAEFSQDQLLVAVRVLDAMGAMFDQLAEERRADGAATGADPAASPETDTAARRVA
ncbi:MAG TPA: MarR family transcriptional regulator [Solirubrobacteraceae bacterium]